MVRKEDSSRALVLRLMVGLALLGCPRAGSAGGTWSVISLPHELGEVVSPAALAVDTAGNLYVADGNSPNGRIQKRDSQGNWSTLAAAGDAPGQVDTPSALAVDIPGNLYVADQEGLGSEGLGSRVQRRDAQGNWSLIASHGSDPGQVDRVSGLAADAAGDLYVANEDSFYNARIQKRDAQGNWSVIATEGCDVGQVQDSLIAVAVDAAGNLYVADPGDCNARIQKWDAQGNWSLIAVGSQGAGQLGVSPTALATDTAGNLYVADFDNGYEIKKRDPQGNWSLLATGYSAVLGQVSGLAVDRAGNLYVADTGNSRVQKYTPGP